MPDSNASCENRKAEKRSAFRHAEAVNATLAWRNALRF
jgi:hypothetical protein